VSTYTPIAHIKLTANASSITFSAIPQGYTDLILVTEGMAQTAGGGAISLRFNSDQSGSSTNYAYGYLFGSGSGTGQGRFGTANGVPTNRHNATDGGTGVAHIQNYSSSQVTKTVISRGGGNNISIAYAGLWKDTAPITSITCYFESGPGFATGFGATLYGIGAGDKAQKAQGGNIVVSDGTYVYHAFTSSGTFEPNQALTADILCIAGGGGGSGPHGGGGGAGGLQLFSSQSLLSSTGYPVIIGAGGSVGAQTASNGGNSVFGSLTASLGGGGGSGFTYVGATYIGVAGAAGGSGGGAGGGSTSGTTAGGAGTSGQGNNGGTGTNTSSTGAGGGGGGAGAGGSNAVVQQGGNGGAGVNTYSTWASATNTGVSGFYAGGGGGGSYVNSSSSAATGGSGGGGNGGFTSPNHSTVGGSSVAGTANTGSGGGGGQGNGGLGANGGSGIVIVRYLA
jgi:hypothetical protein